MEIFLLLLLVVLVIWFNVQSGDKLRELDRKFNELKNQLKNAPQTPPAAPLESKKEDVQEKVIKPAYMPPQPIEEKKAETEIRQPVIEKRVYTPPTYQPPKPIQAPRPSFFERNPDLEKFIGENLVNKIGIAVLVLGIGFFVKYAIDQNWINAFGRVAIGVVCGGILLGIAHYLRKRFKAFSSVLVGGGLAVLYFTIAIAFHQYQLLNQSAAFIIMVIITAFAVLLAIAYNRIEIAVLSLIGGFSTPFILSTGEGNYIVLFTYLMILNIGMLVLAYFKKWNVINILAYAFTIIIYGGWLISKLGDSNSPYLGALIFGSLFYLVFFLMNIINNIKEKRVFAGLDFALLISNTFLYYAAGMYILHNIQNGNFEGLFTAGLAAFNFAFAFLLYKNKSIDRNLVFLLIGLVLSFVSLAAPVQLHGHYITLFWSAEAVLLLWLSQKSGIKLMKLTSIIVMGLMIISLCMDWYQLYYSQILYSRENYKPFAIVFNKGFITGIVSVISVFLSAAFLKRETEPMLYTRFDLSIYKTLLTVIAVVIFYLTVLFELNYQLYERIQFAPACEVIIGLYNILFITGLQIFAMRKNLFVLSNIVIGIGGIAILAYIVYYNEQIIDLRNDFLLGTHATLGMYMFHYLTAVSAFGLLVTIFMHVKKLYKLTSEMGIALLWFTSFMAVYIFSAELTHIMIMSRYSINNSIPDILSQTSKIGFPILWGICSFILMILGMRLKMQQLRIISLTLFFVTLVKLFLFDIRNISEGGKIFAFISLGIILLIVSFMYQKLKVLILADEDNKQKQDKDE